MKKSLHIQFLPLGSGMPLGFPTCPSFKPDGLIPALEKCGGAMMATYTHSSEGWVLSERTYVPQELRAFALRVVLEVLHSDNLQFASATTLLRSLLATTEAGQIHLTAVEDRDFLLQRAEVLKKERNRHYVFWKLAADMFTGTPDRMVRTALYWFFFEGPRDEESYATLLDLWQQSAPDVLNLGTDTRA